MLLKDKVAIITGASSQIGKAISLLFYKEGCKLVLIKHNRSIDLNNIHYYEIKCDVSKEEEVNNMIKEVIAKFSRIDILVNNAGINYDNLLLRIKEEEWNKIIDINLKSVFLCSKAVIRYMLSQRYGKIINISSIVGVTGNVGQAAYAASKAGIIGFSKSIAKEYAKKNILVNVIAPGFITSGMTERINENMKEELKNKIPVGRLGTPTDVANSVLFLASDNANYITGQVFIVDGGLATIIG